jgi:hypothetical protein
VATPEASVVKILPGRPEESWSFEHSASSLGLLVLFASFANPTASRPAATVPAHPTPI